MRDGVLEGSADPVPARRERGALKACSNYGNMLGGSIVSGGGVKEGGGEGGRRGGRHTLQFRLLLWV